MIKDFYKTLAREIHICLLALRYSTKPVEYVENIFCLIFLAAVGLAPIWVTYLIYLVQGC